MRQRETETKIAIGAPAPFNRRLRALDFEPLGGRHLEKNQLFDFPDGRLRAAGRLIRLRRHAGRWTLTVKEPATVRAGIKSRPEHETDLEDDGPLRVLLRAAGLVPTWFYEKYRREWRRGRVHVCVDETPIGNYLEIEAPPAGIRRLARELGLGGAPLISDSYFALMAKRKGTARPGDMRFRSRRP